MRLVMWDEFRTLPEGTVFQEWRPHDLCELQILGEILPNDFVASDLTPSCMTGDYWGDEKPMGDMHLVIAMPVGFGRDGLFELDQRRWLVWDEADRKRLAGWLLDPVSAVRAQNEDDAIYEVPERFT